MIDPVVSINITADSNQVRIHGGLEKEMGIDLAALTSKS